MYDATFYRKSQWQAINYVPKKSSIIDFWQGFKYVSNRDTRMMSMTLFVLGSLLLAWNLSSMLI